MKPGNMTRKDLDEIRERVDKVAAILRRWEATIEREEEIIRVLMWCLDVLDKEVDFGKNGAPKDARSAEIVNLGRAITELLKPV